MLPILALLAAPSAHASSDIEFKTSGPVLIYVDGQQATLNSKMRQRVSGLDAGTHEVRVTGVFGKTLYEADIDVPDNTMTWAEWDRGELKVVRTEWLEDVEEEEPEVDEEVVEVTEPEPEEEPEEVEEVAEVAEAEEVVEVDAPPEIVEEEVPLAVPVTEATTLPAPSTGRTLTVQATDGMRVEVVANGQHLIVVVDGDSFRIIDPNGLELALGR